MIINRIVTIEPLLKFISSICLKNSSEVNKIILERFDESWKIPKLVVLVQNKIWDMVLNPWEYGLNANGIMTCYELFEQLNELKKEYYGNKTKRN